MRLPIQIEGIIFRKAGDDYEFLLLKRIKSRGGFWQPVTGGVETGESVDETVFREVFEETGIKKEEIKRVVKDVYQFEFESDLFENVGVVKEFVYGLEVNKSVEVEIDENEHNMFKWVDYEKALESLKYENNKTGLEELREGMK